MCQTNSVIISTIVHKKLSKKGEAFFWKIVRYDPNNKCWTGPYKKSYRYKPYKNEMNSLKTNRFLCQSFDPNLPTILKGNQYHGIHVVLTRKMARELIRTLKKDCPSRICKIIKVVGKLKDFVSAGRFDANNSVETAVFRKVYIRKGQNGIDALNRFPRKGKV